ncbi:tetratricopeptide repeat protein [Streptomyces sp. NBC_00203]|uniref:tetratricopeptide repeat protein n=1 Tax=Streptomyces sp. NBC_00203 TaxID=2975680 RepID=UPI0032502CD0
MESLLRARELAGARKFRESRALVERAEPRSAEEFSLAASVLLQLRDPEAALPLAERAVALDPGDWRGWVAIADADWLLGRGDSAVAAARTAVRLAPDEAAPHRALGSALYKAGGHGAEARREWKRAKELGGGRGALRQPWRPNPWIWVVLAVFLVAGTLTLVGDWPEGLRAGFQTVRAVSFLAIVLFVRSPRRAGLGWPARFAEIRATNERLYGGGGREARVKVAVTLGWWGSAAGLCVMPLAGPESSWANLPLWGVVSARADRDADRGGGPGGRAGRTGEGHRRLSVARSASRGHRVVETSCGHVHALIASGVLCRAKPPLRMLQRTPSEDAR